MMAGNLRRPLSPRRDYSPRDDYRDSYNYPAESRVRARSPTRMPKRQPSYSKENLSPKDKDYDSYPHLSRYQQYRPGERTRSPPPPQRTASKVSPLRRNDSTDSTTATIDNCPSDTEIKRNANLYESTVASLVSLFSQLSDEVTDHAALKLQHSRLKHTLEVRTAEYDKGKQFHEKYPSTEESQRRAKEQAESEFRSIDENLSKKATSLKNTATSIAIHVVPNSITTAQEDRIALEKLRERCNTLETTCKELERKYQEQKKICDEQLQHSSKLSLRCEELEKKQKVQQDSSTMMKTRQDKLEEQLKTEAVANRDIVSSNAKIGDIEAKLSEMSAEIVKERSRLETEVKTLAEKNTDLSVQVQSHRTLQTDLNKLKENLHKEVAGCRELIEHSNSESDKLQRDINFKELENLKDTVVKLQHRIYGDGSTTKGLDDTVFELALDEQRFRNELEKLQKTDERITAELRERDKKLLDELKERDARVSALESTAVTEKILSLRIAAVRDDFSNALKNIEKVLERKSAELGITKEDILKEVSSPLNTHVSRQDGEVAEDTTRPAVVSKAEFDEFKKNIADFRAGQEKADEITGSFLSALQDDTRKLAAWTKKLLSLPNDLEQVKDELKNEITIAHTRIKALESQASSVNQRLEELDKLRDLLKVHNKKLEVATSLPASFKELKDTQDQQDQFLSTMRNEIGKLQSLQKTMEDRVSRQSTLEHEIHHKSMSPKLNQPVPPRANGTQTPSRVASPVIPSHKEGVIQPSQQAQDAVRPSSIASQKANEALANRLDAAELGIRTLAARMDNINTMDLAQNMLVQLENVYPNLRNVEASINLHGQALNELKNQCQVYSSNIGLLNRIVNKLDEIAAQVRVMRDSKNLPASGADKITEGLQRIAHEVVSATQGQGQRPARLDQRSNSYEFPSQQLPSTSASRVVSQGSLKRKSPNTVVTSVGPDGQPLKRVRTQTDGENNPNPR